MSEFINDTTLTGIYKAALAMIVQNELGGNDDNAFTISDVAGSNIRS